MAMLKSCILQNFATIGIPDFEEGALHKSWSIVALSQNLIDEERLNGLQHLSTRPLDLVIHNGTKYALLNMQAFKIFDCELATKTVAGCLTHYLTSDGNLLFGVLPSGDLTVLTDGFQRTMIIKKPTFIKIQQRSPKWYEGVLGRLSGVFFSKSKVSQVSPEEPLQNIQINANLSSISTGANMSSSSSSHYCVEIPGNVKSVFPYLTSLQDGLVIFCAFSPAHCYVFLSSYETKLKKKSISNIRGDQVPGQWYRIIMSNASIVQWLIDKKAEPVFEARLCYKRNEDGEQKIGGAMLYGVFETVQLALTYGIIRRPNDMFMMSWEKLHYEIDLIKIKDNSTTYDLKPGYVAKLSSDATKIAIVISSHVGMYIHVQNIPCHQEDPLRLQRQKVSLCNHSDYDGTHFYKKECWISDVQWLVEDTYLAVITRCGSLSIFYTSGEPMIVKVRKPGPDTDETKSARFYFPVFHPHQIRVNEQDQENNGDADGKSSLSYPTIKWIDSEQVLTCSSGIKIELFSIQRVLPIGLDKGQSEIWLEADERYDAGAEAEEDSEKRKITFLDEDCDAESFTSYTSTNRPLSSALQKPFLVPDIDMLLRTTVEKAGRENVEEEVKEKMSPVMEYAYEREKDGNAESSMGNDNSDYDEESNPRDEYPRNDVETPSRIEELPPDGGELEEENLESVPNVEDLTPEKLRLGQSAESSSLDAESEKIHREISAIFLDSEENFLSFPSSMHQLNDEYSDGSSEPDFVGNGLATAAHGQEQAISPPNPYIFSQIIQPENEMNDAALRKRSQQYLADDEADYCSEDERRLEEIRRKSVVRSPITPDESDHPPPRSSTPYYDTEYSRETYSSPFSYVTSTAEDREEEGEDDDDVQNEMFSAVNPTVITKKGSVPTTIHWEAPRAAKEARSRTSNISLVSLQIPPVPVISAVIVPTERQSDNLLQNIEMNSLAQQPQSQHQQESMIYKPPTTTSTIVGEPPSKVDILHMKNAAAAVIHGATPPCQEPNSREYFAEEENEEEEDDQSNVNRNELNFSPANGNDPFKYHHHQQQPEPSV